MLCTNIVINLGIWIVGVSAYTIISYTPDEKTTPIDTVRTTQKSFQQDVKYDELAGQLQDALQFVENQRKEELAEPLLEVCEAFNVLENFKRKCLQKFITAPETTKQRKAALGKFLRDDDDEVASKLRTLIPRDLSPEEFINMWEDTYIRISMITLSATDMYQRNNGSENIILEVPDFDKAAGGFHRKPGARVQLKSHEKQCVNIIAGCIDVEPLAQIQ